MKTFLRTSVCATMGIFIVVAVTGCDKMCCQEGPQAGAQAPASSGSATATTMYLDIQGMHCDGCVQAIDAEARAIDGVTDVHVSLEKHSVQLKIATPELAAKVESAIHGLGYTVTVVPAPN